MVSGSISLLCSRFFSPFLHSTGSLSVSREYLALRDGPRGFIQDFSCPALLRCRLGFASDSSTGLSPSLIQLSNWFDFLRSCLYRRSFYPAPAETETVWALPRSLATTSGIIVYFLFLWVMRCFSSPRLLTDLQCVALRRRVAPFGDLRVSGYLLLTVAFRSLSRPSSPSRA